MEQTNPKKLLSYIQLNIDIFKNLKLNRVQKLLTKTSESHYAFAMYIAIILLLYNQKINIKQKVEIDILCEYLLTTKSELMDFLKISIQEGLFTYDEEGFISSEDLETRKEWIYSKIENGRKGGQKSAEKRRDSKKEKVNKQSEGEISDMFEAWIGNNYSSGNYKVQKFEEWQKLTDEERLKLYNDTLQKKEGKE
jgi:hypothetical protein